MRLIDVDMLRETLTNHATGEIARPTWGDIEHASTVEFKKGKWIDRERCQVDEDGFEIALCSVCKAEIVIESMHDSYCPNCGARLY